VLHPLLSNRIQSTNNGSSLHFIWQIYWLKSLFKPQQTGCFRGSFFKGSLHGELANHLPLMLAGTVWLKPICYFEKTPLNISCWIAGRVWTQQDHCLNKNQWFKSNIWIGYNKQCYKWDKECICPEEREGSGSIKLVHLALNLFLILIPAWRTLLGTS